MVARVVVMLGLVGSVSGVGAASAYHEVVAPIFRARCAGCHGAEKQKGKLALHTWERVALGGDSGPLWVEGKPEESELVRRLKLPKDDEEHMPPADEEQLTAEETALLVRWIERGASEKMSVEALALPPALAKAAAELRERLAATEGTKPKADPEVELSAEKVEQARAPLAGAVRELQRRFPGALSYESRSSAALHFTAAGLGREFGDAELAALVPLADRLTLLDIAGTAVTDGSAAVLEKFGALRVLRAGRTEMGDAIVPALAKLERLESLALAETKITASGVGALRSGTGLRKLFVTSGAVSEAARAAGLPVVDAGLEALAIATDADGKN